MGNTNKYRLIACIFVTVLGLWLLSPTIIELMNPDIEEMPKGVPDTAMRLGLDLKGGVHMVLGVDLESVVDQQVSQYGKSLEKAFQGEGFSGVAVKILAEKKEIEITTPSETVSDQVAEYIGKNYGGTLDIVGEFNNIMAVQLTNQSEEFVRTRARDQSIETIRNRIDEFGIAEPIITKRGEDQVLVQFPGAKEPDRLKKLIGQTAQLNFHIVDECTESEPDCMGKQQAMLLEKIKKAEEAGSYNKDTYTQFSEYRDRLNKDLAGELPKDTFIAFEKTPDPNEIGKFSYRPYLLSSVNMLSGQYIEDAFVSMDSGSGIGVQTPVVSFRMDTTGAPLLGQLTSEYRKHYMAIVLDGVVKSAPVIQSTISEAGQITLGRGDLQALNQEARDLSIVLRAGALPASIEIQEERIIGPSIGRDAIESGKTALIYAAIFVLLFMWLYYGKAGLVASFVTVINIALIFAILGSLNATLTLPGIAGVVLTIGMAVDALIIIFERMREEMRAGRNNRQIIEMGFDKALSTILDSNITTVIGAFILLNYGTGTIRGFAFTLIVGIVCNVFMATFFMKTMFNFFFTGQRTLGVGLSKKELKEIGAMR